MRLIYSLDEFFIKLKTSNKIISQSILNRFHKKINEYIDNYTCDKTILTEYKIRVDTYIDIGILRKDTGLFDNFVSMVLINIDNEDIINMLEYVFLN